MENKPPNTLVLCIDRDDDLGRKTGIKGPLVGWEKNLEAAQRLALEDPEDTDVNALYGALKLSKTLGVEVVTVTGNGDVGVVSDKIVADQLDVVLKQLSPDSVIVVTDGMDDQQVLPLIQSRVKVNAVHTVVVRQSKELEKAYFKFTNFLKEISGDPNLARLLFGIPGIALILLAFGGIQALNLILAVTGVYLVLKGMGWEEGLFEGVSNFLRTLSVERIETIIYLIAFITFVIGAGYAYGDLKRFPLSVDFDNMDSTLSSISMFLLNSSSITLLMIAALVAITGRIIDEYASQKYVSIRRNLVLLAFIVLIRDMLGSGASFIVNEEYAIGNFIVRSTVGIMVFGMWTKFTEYFFMAEIESIRRVVKDLTNKDVYTPDGKHLGKVTSVFMDGMELSGLRVGKARFKKADIVSTGNVVIVNAASK